ncbi:DUF305 domain-containing protein, partial [Halomonas marinisediminis]
RAEIAEMKRYISQIETAAEASDPAS